MKTSASPPFARVVGAVIGTLAVIFCLVPNAMRAEPRPWVERPTPGPHETALPLPPGWLRKASASPVPGSAARGRGRQPHQAAASQRPTAQPTGAVLPAETRAPVSVGPRRARALLHAPVSEGAGRFEGARSGVSSAPVAAAPHHTPEAVTTGALIGLQATGALGETRGARAIFGTPELAIPGIPLGPSQLLFLILGAQLVFAAAWLPLVRRLLGGFDLGRRR